MKELRLLIASMTLTCFALFPAVSHADDDLDVTMDVFDDLSKIDGMVADMQGPEMPDADDDDGDHGSDDGGEHHGDDGFEDDDNFDNDDALDHDEDDFDEGEDIEDDIDDDGSDGSDDAGGEGPI